MISREVDAFDVDIFFLGLEKIVNDHILENTVLTEDVFATLDGFSPVMHTVSIDVLERVLRLYEDVKEQYSEYMNQFYTAVVNMFNRNYAEPKDEVVIDDDDLPF